MGDDDATTTTMAHVHDEETRDCPYVKKSTATYYHLGFLQDYQMIATNDGIRISSRSEPRKCVKLTLNRWARLRALLSQIDEEARELNKKSRPVAYSTHIGDGYYVSLNSGVMCVDIGKYFLPYGLEPGNERPTKPGVSLNLQEWKALFDMFPIIEAGNPELAAAKPCYENGDHMNQLGMLTCTTCNPFDHMNWK